MRLLLPLSYQKKSRKLRFWYINWSNYILTSKMNRFSIILTICMLLPQVMWAQSDSSIEVYSFNNQPFYLHINDIQQNNVAGSRVIVKNLAPSNYKLKLIFSNASISPVFEDVYLPEQTAVVYTMNNNRQMNYVTSKNVVPNEQTPVSEDAIVEQGKVYIDKIYSPSQGEVNIVIGGTTAENDIKLIGNPNNKTVQSTTVEVSSVGCNQPVDNYELSDIVSLVSSEEYEEDKLDMAKALIRNNCFNASQLVEILFLLGTETDRFTLVNQAISKIHDRQNADLIQQVFTDPATIQNFQLLLNQ